MLLDLGIVAAILAFGNIKLRHFDPRIPLRRRVLKVFAALAVTAIISHYLGRTGVLIGLGIVMLPVVYIHGIWLPRHGVNGWTGEPREKYYALRGWPRKNTEFTCALPEMPVGVCCTSKACPLCPLTPI